MPIINQSSKPNDCSDGVGSNHGAASQSPKASIRICVLLANVAPLFAEIVETLLRQQPDMEYVGSLQGNLDILFGMNQKIDVLLLGAEQIGAMPGIASHLLGEFPHLRIITLSYEMTEGMMYWTGIYSQEVKSISAENLMNSIRQIYTVDER